MAPKADAEDRLGDPALTADPNAPIFAYGYRGAIRGRFSANIPVVSPADTDGVWFGLRPLVELHNEPGEFREGPAFLPVAFWRARLAFELGYARRLRADSDSAVLGFSVELEHESNHTTDLDAEGLLSFHDVAARVQLAFPLRPDLVLSLSLRVRLLVLSCTRLSYGCTGDTGSTGVESVADAGLAWRPRQSSVGAFVAVHGSYLPPSEALVREDRVVLRGGLLIDPGTIGRFQFYIEALLGHDVGLWRERRSARLGGGVAWAI